MNQIVLNREISRPLQLLPTVLVRLKIGDKWTDPVRGLFDTGSHLNLVTNKVIKRYGFRCHPMRTKVTGLECEPIQITRRIKARIYSWFDPKKYIKIIIWILPSDSKWRPNLPNRLIHSNEI